jgi:hypothetical protein
MNGKLLLNTIILIHILLCIAALVAPYLTNNILYLSIFIFFYISVVSLWNSFGNCFITKIENHLSGEKGSSNSYISNLASRLFGSYTKLVFSFVVWFNTLVCIFKINRQVRN